MTSFLGADAPAVDGVAAVSVPRQRASFAALRQHVRGAVLEPHDAGYDELVSPWNLAVPMQPAAVVAAQSADDVAAAVRFARASGLTVGVQATGHGAITALAGDVLVITRGLDEVTVHPEGWARVGAGVKWLEVITAAAPHGLAPLNGSSSDVGVVGYTTGGGVGPMARTFGLASDRVRAFEVVTGDGVLRRVTATEHADLFFALRGGKGAAGIVTAVEFDLVRLPQFYGGAVYFDGADAAAVVDRWRAWSDALPHEGTTSFAVMQLPPLPFLPPPLAGRMTVSVRLVWTGDPAEGERRLDEMRAAAPVVLDDAGIKPYTAVDSVHSDPVDPSPAAESALLLTDFPAAAAAGLLDAVGPGSGSALIAVEVRQLGGAYARPATCPDAFAHRDARYSVHMVGSPFDPATGPRTGLVHAALGQWDTGGIWPNFAPARDAETARRAYDAGTLERLRAVAAAYDPDRVLLLGTAALGTGTGAG